MDILAARKKAAELAKAKRAEPAERPVPEPVEPPAPAQIEPEPYSEASAFPPLPETSFDGEELLFDAEKAEEAELSTEGADEPDVRDAGMSDAGQAAVPEETPGAIEAEAGPGDDEPDEESGIEQEREMLAFRLGSEEYVVPVDQVQEVLTPREITPVPHVPDYIVGVCSLRGIVLPIIDLHRRLGLSAAAWDEKSRIIVVNFGQDDRIGLYVDRVRGVVRFAPSSVRPVPESIEQGAEFLQGIARKDDRLFILLDAGRTAEF